MDNHPLQDQVVLITGAGRPPAPAIARAFAAQGAILALNDLSPIPLQPILDEVRSQAGRIEEYIADATRGMPLRAMLDDVLANWGRIDILINNPRIRPQAPLIDMDEWDWQRAIEMNLNGPFLVSQLVARQMRQQGQGIILNIIDRSALEQPSPGDAAYTAGQAGLLALSTAAAREFLAYNIRVHTLCPEPSALAGGDALAGLAVRLCAPAARLPGQGYNLTRAPQNGQPQE